VAELTTASGQGPVRRAPRVQASLAFVQRVRPALYALLVGSALVSFWAGSDGARMPTWVSGVAPLLFGAFLLIFSVYRFALIRARHYPAATGLFQIGLGALVVVLLLPGTRHAISTRARVEESGGDDALELMSSLDPRVRALAAEVAGERGSGARYASALLDRLSDPDPRVRTAARASLTKLLGSDVAAGVSDEAAAAKLRPELASRGWLRSPP